MPYRTIVVGTDGSDSSLAAVRTAARLTASTNARLTIVCAYLDVGQHDTGSAGDILKGDAYRLRGLAPLHDVLRTARETALAAGAKSVEVQLIHGYPASAIVDACDEHSADLIVVGNLRVDTLGGRLLGTVAMAVTRAATSDVLVVHTTERGSLATDHASA